MSKRINVLAELDRVGLDYSFSGDDEVRVLCPFHEDNSPSCSVNTENAIFYCQVCKKGGDIVALISRIVGQTRALVYLDLAQRYGLESDPTIDPQVIERYHSKLWEAGPLLKELRLREVSDAAIRKYRLGENKGRVTIPIKNAAGYFVNIRSYLPGAPGADKMKNEKGRGSKPRLFPYEQLRFDSLAIVGGEIKAIAAAEILNKNGIGAVSNTSGEGNWDTSLNRDFANKDVSIVYDIDDEGLKSAEDVAFKLYPVARTIRIVHLPLDRDEFPKGDVNDYLHELAQGKELPKLHELISATDTWRPDVKDVTKIDESEAIAVSYAEAYSSGYAEKKIEFQAIVSAISESPYLIPKNVKLACGRDQDFCAACPVLALSLKEFVVSSESKTVLEMVDSPSSKQRGSLMRCVGIPEICPSVSFDVVDYYDVDDIRISPKLEILTKDEERQMQRVLSCNPGVKLNENYKFVGSLHPHPRDQSASIVASDYEPVGDALSHYNPDDHIELLKKFQCDDDKESLKSKLHEIYADLESNVTRIYQRRRMHLVMDLVWHSPLFIKFDNKVEKGWCEGLIVGDSGQGKSRASESLLKHYKAGMRLDCKNATVAGLLGGLQKLGNRWFVSWGVIPTHDRRLVILEEIKGASVETLSKLTDTRSSGIAEIPKIEKRRTTARTRLLAISNARSERKVASYGFGVEVVKELIGALEDIRRFDICYIVSGDDVEARTINMLDKDRPHVKHIYDSDSCKHLILWAWTRTEDQIVFEPEAEKAILEQASLMCENFCDEIPIVDRGTMRYKLARLSASLACRVFSTDDNHRVLIKKTHVDFISEFLTNMYSEPSFGYIEYAKSVKASKTIADIDTVEKAIRTVVHAREFAECLLRTSKFDQQDFRDWGGIDRDESSVLISKLVRKRAIVRHGRSYVKTPGFIDVLKKLIDEGLPEVPDFMEGGEF